MTILPLNYNFEHRHMEDKQDTVLAVVQQLVQLAINLKKRLYKITFRTEKNLSESPEDLEQFEQLEMVAMEDELERNSAFVEQH